MDRPTPKTLKYVDYCSMADYIDEKYGITQRDYAKKFKGGRQHQIELGLELVDPPYLDFWHWMLENHIDERIYNGAYSTISFVRARETAVEKNDDWARDIIDLYIKEYGGDFWDDADGWFSVHFSW